MKKVDRVARLAERHQRAAAQKPRDRRVVARRGEEDEGNGRRQSIVVAQIE